MGLRNKIGGLGILGAPWTEDNKHGCAKYIEIREEEVLLFKGRQIVEEGHIGGPFLRIPYNMAAGVLFPKVTRANTIYLKYTGGVMMAEARTRYHIVRQDNGGVMITTATKRTDCGRYG